MSPYRTPPAPEPEEPDEPAEPAKPKWINPYAPDPTIRPRPWNGTAPESNSFLDALVAFLDR